MYLRHLEIDGMKLLREFSLDFTRDGQPRMWTVLVGRNGLCKTSILRAIALAASGRDLANQLAVQLWSSFPDRRSEQGRAVNIRAVFDLGAPLPAGQTRQLPHLPDTPERRLCSELTLSTGHRVFEARSGWGSSCGSAMDGTDPLARVRSQSLPFWFVGAYGVGRSLPAGDGRLDDRVRTRMESLFDVGSLIATDFAKRFSETFGDQVANIYIAALRDVVLRHVDLLPDLRDFDIRPPASTQSLDFGPQCRIQAGKQPLLLPPEWLSHGYQTTLAWLADVVGHLVWDAFVAAGGTIELAPEAMQGLVLVDELDLHLHPSWQVGLIPAIRQTFPNLQFVVTTHSPMLLAGLEADEIIMLEQDTDSGDVIGRQPERAPKLMTGTELLQRYFGIDRLHPSNLSKAAYRYARLASDPKRSAAEDTEVRQLLEQLQAAGVAPDWSPVEREGS